MTKLICASKEAPCLRGWIDNDLQLPTHAQSKFKDSDATGVIRISTFRRFASSWSRLCDQPVKHARQWCTLVNDISSKDVLDGWQFQCVNGNKIQGLIRVKSSDVAAQLLKASGMLIDDARLVWSSPTSHGRSRGLPGILLSPGKHTSIVHGLMPTTAFHGQYQIGVRVHEDDPRLVPTWSRWWMQTTPRFWGVDQATCFAETLGFVDIDMISKNQCRQGAAWLFKARRTICLAAKLALMMIAKVKLSKMPKGDPTPIQFSRWLAKPASISPVSSQA